MTAAAAIEIEIGIFSGMDCGVGWQGFDAQVAVDWLLRTPEQMSPKIPPLNRRERQSGSWIAENYARTGRTSKINPVWRYSEVPACSGCWWF
jgi:hypothetical protein